MAKKDRSEAEPQDSTEPSLEMPTLGSLFGRKRKASRATPATDVDTATQAPDSSKGVEAEVVEPEDFEPEAAESEAESIERDDSAKPDSSDDPAAMKRADSAEPESSEEIEADTETQTVSEPELDNAKEEATPAEPAEAAEAEVVEPEVSEPEAAEPAEPAERSIELDDSAEPESSGAPPARERDDSAEADEAEPERRTFALPALPGHWAATITGALVGLLTVGGTMLALGGCERFRGTSSCGGPGFFLILAILLILILAGSKLLQAWGIADPFATSILGVGLLAVICLLFLIDALMSPWMIVVIPLVGIATFVLSTWVTETFAEA